MKIPRKKHCDLIDVEYEPLPAIFDPMDAIKEDALQIHDGVELNINVNRHIEWGDVDEAFKKCDVIREDQFKCSSQHHACMETHCAVASYDYGNKLTVWTSTQSAYYVQALLAGMLGMSEGDIRVIKPHTGGGFGGKFEIDSAQFCAALLSQKLYRPVKIVLTREEEFTATKRRTPMYYNLKLGATKDGTLLAKEVRVLTEGGAYTGMGATALYLTGFFSSFPYKYPNYRYDGYRAYTNTAPTSAQRGFGAPQAVFAGEQQIDMMAEDLGIDPIEIRRKNGMTPITKFPVRLLFRAAVCISVLIKSMTRLKNGAKLYRPITVSVFPLTASCPAVSSTGSILRMPSLPPSYESATMVKLTSLPVPVTSVRVPILP